MAINQKGANGLIAEYKCASELNLSLKMAGYEVGANQSELERNLSETIKRVGNELTPSQIERALAQGLALSNYLLEKIMFKPNDIGILQEITELRSSVVTIRTIGNNTNSGNPADLLLAFESKTLSLEVPASLKAYRGPESSLGSKSGRASLARMFLGKEQISDQEFIDAFGKPATQYINVLNDFKETSKEFYESELGKKFVAKYFERKGTNKVNNPLRRKEVGDYFTQKRGYKSEHKLAQLYVEMYNAGLKTKGDSVDKVAEYITALRFILGNPEMLILDAKANDAGKVSDIQNSLDHPVYKSLNQALRPGSVLKLKHKSGSSIIGVQIQTEQQNLFNNLSLAMWKDGTIQYKLNTKRVS